MNRKILQKLIAELSKTQPSIPYALGILETIIESLPEETSSLTIKEVPVGDSMLGGRLKTTQEAEKDEAKALEYMAKAKLESVKQMAGDVE